MLQFVHSIMHVACIVIARCCTQTYLPLYYKATNCNLYKTAENVKHLVEAADDALTELL